MRRALVLLLLATLLAGCTQGNGGSGSSKDPDNDGMDSPGEIEGKIIEITTLTGVERRHVTSDPRVHDTDGDGLNDGDEYARGTDPRDFDTDDDGLLDGPDLEPRDEAQRSAWRAAGILERDGVFLGELNACPPGGPQLRGNVASSDLPVPDLLLDGEELRGWDILVRGEPRHVTSNPCATDTDGDGLFDHDERALLTDPREADTDGDGVPDGSDADPAADLGLAFANLRATSERTGAIRIVVAAGAATDRANASGNETLHLDVDDRGPRDSLLVRAILTAEDAETGEPLALFEDPRGALVLFDLVAGTVEGAEVEGATLVFRGDDGTLRMDWSTARR